METKTADEILEDIIEAEAQRRYPVNEITQDFYVQSKITFKHGARFGHQHAASQYKSRIEELEKKHESLWKQHNRSLDAQIELEKDDFKQRDIIESQRKRISDLEQNEPLKNAIESYEKILFNERKRIETLTEVLKKLHSNTLYQLHPDDDRITHAPNELFDEVEAALNPKVNP